MTANTIAKWVDKTERTTTPNGERGECAQWMVRGAAVNIKPKVREQHLNERKIGVKRKIYKELAMAISNDINISKTLLIRVPRSQLCVCVYVCEALV